MCHRGKTERNKEVVKRWGDWGQRRTRDVWGAGVKTTKRAPHVCWGGAAPSRVLWCIYSEEMALHCVLSTGRAPFTEMLNTDASILNSIFFWEKKKITWHFLGGPLVSSEGKVAATQHKSTPSDNLSSMMTHSFGRREGSLTGCHILIHRAREVAKWFNEYKHNVNHALRALWTQLWDRCASVTTKETSS